MDEDTITTRAVAKALISAAAPDELPLLEEIASALSRPTEQRRDPLASGIGDSWAWSQLASPALIGVAVWMTKDVVGKATSELLVPRLKYLVERLAFGKPSTPVDHSLSPEDYRTIAATLDVVRHHAKERGMASDHVERVCQAVAVRLEAALRSIPPS